MDYLSKFPSELKLKVLEHVDATDIAKLNSLNRAFYDFYGKFAHELPRFEISTLEFRGSKQLTGNDLISVNLFQKHDGFDQLWKYCNYNGLDISPIFEWSKRITLCNGIIQLRLFNLVISPKNLFSLIHFIKAILPRNFKKGQLEFKIYMVSCDFYETSLDELALLFDFFISLGVQAFTFEDVPSYIFVDLCNALAKTDIHLVDTLRLHSTNSEGTEMNGAIFNLLTSVSRIDRRMTKLIIDGHPIPMPIISDFITEFCANPYVDIVDIPPYIRCFFSINNQMTIADVKDLRDVSHQKINSRKRRSLPPAQEGVKRRRTQIFVEFGYYEEDLPISQQLHAVIGLSVNEWTQKRRLNYD